MVVSISLHVSDPGFEFGDSPAEARNFNIARFRCSSNGRGPRRSIGPGASNRSIIGGRRKHRVGRSCP